MECQHHLPDSRAEALASQNQLGRHQGFSRDNRHSSEELPAIKLDELKVMNEAPEDEPDEEIISPGCQFPVPIVRATIFAAAYNDIASREEIGEYPDVGRAERLVGEVGAEPLHPCFLKTREDGLSCALVLLMSQEADFCILLCEFLDNRWGVVGAAIVDNDDFVILNDVGKTREIIGELRQRLSDDWFFVKNRDDVRECYGHRIHPFTATTVLAWTLGSTKTNLSIPRKADRRNSFFRPK